MSGNPTSSAFLGWNVNHGGSRCRHSSLKMRLSGEANRHFMSFASDSDMT
ncbi:MAG: hypothetical protein R8M38_00180 [Mariprofundaceae bacterium]